MVPVSPLMTGKYLQYLTLISSDLSFPLEFGILAVPGKPNYERNGWLVGLVNAAPYIASSLWCARSTCCWFPLFTSFYSGCWLSDPLNNYLGRRGTIFVTALILIATPIASGFTHSWETLFVVRLILGIGMGAKGKLLMRYMGLLPTLFP